MIKVYVFSYESMCMDLLYNGVEELEIEVIAGEIIGELELSNIISVDGTYVIGNITAFLLKEKYQVFCQEVELT